MYFLTLTVKKSHWMYIRKTELNCTFFCASLQILDLLWPPRKSLGQLCGKIMEERQSISKKSVGHSTYAVNTPSGQVRVINSLRNLFEQTCNWFGITHNCNEYLYACTQKQSLKYILIWVCRASLSAWFSNKFLLLDITFLLRKKGSHDTDVTI